MIICEGKVEVRNYKNHLLDTLESGRTIGGESFFINNEIKANYIVIEDVRCVCLKLTDFSDFTTVISALLHFSN